MGRPPFGAELLVAGQGRRVLLLLGEQLEPQQLTDAVIYETRVFLRMFWAGGQALWARCAGRVGRAQDVL